MSIAYRVTCFQRHLLPTSLASNVTCFQSHLLPTSLASTSLDSNVTCFQRHLLPMSLYSNVTCFQHHLLLVSLLTRSGFNSGAGWGEVDTRTDCPWTYQGLSEWVQSVDWTVARLVLPWRGHPQHDTKHGQPGYFHCQWTPVRPSLPFLPGVQGLRLWGPSPLLLVCACNRNV